VKEAWNSRPNGSEFDEIMMAADALAIKGNLGFGVLARVEQLSLIFTTRLKTCVEQPIRNALRSPLLQVILNSTSSLGSREWCCERQARTG
jgi:hypothetical protein